MKRSMILTLILALAFLGSAFGNDGYDPCTGKFVGPAAGASVLKHDSPLRPAAETLYGIDVTGDSLYKVDKNTAATTYVAAVGSPVIAGLAWDAVSGTLYGTDTSTGNLVTVDTSTGATTVIGATGVYLPHGLAIDPNTGTMYTMDDTSNLYSINKATGASTLIGPVGYPHIGALDFDPATGILYGAYAWMDSTGYLITVNTATGQGTFVANTHRINGMSFDENGNLYASENGLMSGVNSSLYSVNKSTGAWTLIGSLGVDNMLGLIFTAQGGGMQLAVSPNPLVSGQSGLFSVTGGNPNAATYLAYSLVGTGSTYVPFLKVTIDLANPKQAGSIMYTNSSGDGSWKFTIPMAGSGRNVWLQAVQVQNKSNVVASKIL